MSRTAFVPEPAFDEYRERFKHHFVMERTGGVLEVRMHNDGGEAIWSLELHRALTQMFRAVANDRENHILILTGTGDYWFRVLDSESFAQIEHDDDVFRRKSYDMWYRDGMRMVESLLWDVDIPTIAVVNGPGFHTEFALLCDVTICADDARFFEAHLNIGLAPGDGLFLVLQELLGTKRATYAMHTVQRINAPKALEWGLVNEVLPREQLLPRAREIASIMMTRDPFIRHMTTQIVKRRWKRLFTDDLGFHISHEMWGTMVHRGKH